MTKILSEAKMPKPNTLYYGDSLDVLRQHIKDESVDLVYLDPPFNSAQDYNVLFQEHDGRRAAAQIQAFTDTWRWDQSAAAAYQEIVEGGGRVSDVMRAFYTFLGASDMMAYLAMMAPRLVELRRVLKPTGSLYLHCDPTASHYLKLLLDAEFSPNLFRSEIIWKRSASHGGASSYNDTHDVLLYYAKSKKQKWLSPRIPHDASYILSHYSNMDSDGRRFQLVSAHGAGGGPPRRFGDVEVSPPAGRHWMSQEHIDEMMSKGLVVFTRTGMPRYKRYLESTDGVPLTTVWDDIPPINSQAAERLGYPTQKPIALLERVLCANTTEGDIVLDPFCGCGTTIAAAQTMGRQWIGIDITHLAINLIRHRLKDQFGAEAKYKVIGEPTTIDGAIRLAEDDPYQFQWWALGLVGARPIEQKKGADKGVDGKIYFHDDTSGKTKQVVISVKAGKLQAQYIRDLRGVVEREQAAIGVLISLNAPTGPMKTEAASAGFYMSPGWNTKHPRMQLLTVGELLAGRGIDMPPLHQVNQTFKKAAKAGAVKKDGTGKLFE